MEQIMALYVTEGHAGQAQDQGQPPRGTRRPGPGSEAASQRDMLGGPEAAMGGHTSQTQGPQGRGPGTQRASLGWNGGGVGAGRWS